jgi:hypothetical protein
MGKVGGRSGASASKCKEEWRLVKRVLGFVPTLGVRVASLACHLALNQHTFWLILQAHPLFAMPTLINACVGKRPQWLPKGKGLKILAFPIQSI